MLGNDDHEFGVGSYHRGQASDLKKLLSNEIFREQLVAKVSSDLAIKFVDQSKPPRPIDNKTSELRKENTKQKIKL